MLVETINGDYIKAMKDKDSLRSSTLSFLRAQLKNSMIEKKVQELEDNEVIIIIKKQIKQRQDSIEQFEKGDRLELAEKEKKELLILKSYLPEEMPESELKTIVVAAIQEVGASSMKEMGQVMKIVQEKVAGRADNKLVSQLVKNQLTNAS